MEQNQFDILNEKINSLHRLVREQGEVINKLVKHPEIVARMRKNKTSQFKGVSFNRRSGLWKAQITVKGKSKYIGMFDTQEQARTEWEKEFSKGLSEMDLKREIAKGTFHFLYQDYKSEFPELAKDKENTEIKLNKIFEK